MKRVFQIIVLTILLSASWMAEPVVAQAQPDAPVLAGSWEGTMMIGPNSFTLGFTFGQVEDNYVATFTSRDMGVYGMPADSVVVENNRIRIRVLMVDGEYNGILRMDERNSSYIRIDGDWFQESELLPVTLLPVKTQ